MFKRQFGKVEDRPFGQSRYNLAKIKMPSVLSGLALRFTFVLPVLKGGIVIFLGQEEESLRRLFSDDFGGYTCTNHVTHPLLMGGYKRLQHVVPGVC